MEFEKEGGFVWREGVGATRFTARKKNMRRRGIRENVQCIEKSKSTITNGGRKTIKTRGLLIYPEFIILFTSL